MPAGMIAAATSLDPDSWFRIMPPGLTIRRYERPFAERRLTGQRA